MRRLRQAGYGVALLALIPVTGLGNGDCGFDFETGLRYRIEVERAARSLLYTDICLGTRQLDPPPPASACGRVVRPDGRGIAKAEVTLTEIRRWPLPADTTTVLSDPDGSYCMRGLRPGRYLVSMEEDNYPKSAEALPARTRWAAFYPGGLDPARARPLAVTAGETISGLDFSGSLQPLFGVTFHVLPAAGHALPKPGVEVWLDAPGRDALSYHVRDLADAEGWRGYSMIPPGRYTVSVFTADGGLLLRRQVRLEREATIDLRLR